MLKQAVTLYKFFLGFHRLTEKSCYSVLKNGETSDGFSIFKDFLASFNGEQAHPNISEKGNRTVFSATALTHTDKSIAEFDYS